MTGRYLNKILISLAFLKVNWDQGKSDYIDNFLPFLATLMIRKKYKSIEENAEQINKLINDFEQEFGLIIPYHPMLTILNRAKKKGLIRKQEHKFVPTEKVIEYDFSGKTQAQERRYEKLINSFISFCNDRYKEKLNREEAEKILIGFLKQHDLEILFAAYGKSALPEVKQSRSNIFLFNKFVESIYTQDQELFEILLDIVIGHILANIVLYGYEFNEFSKPKLEGLNLYLDTRLILRLLGTEGEEFQSAYSKLLPELKAQGVNLFVFEHTYEEIMGILESCVKWIDNPNYNPYKASSVLRHFKEEGYRESDIQMFINRVDAILNEYSIKRTNTPPPMKDADYQIDERKLQQFIVDVYKTYNPDFEVSEKEYTIQRDIQSISAIYKLRKGKRPKNIKQANHIFVTINSALAYANKIFEKEEYGEGFCIPACVTDTFVGTLIWLRNPMKVVEINEKKFIAEVNAALQPNEVLLKRYLEEVEKLKNNKKISDEDYILLRDSQVAKKLLTEETLGDPDRFMPKTPIEILNNIKNEAYKLYLHEKEEHQRTKKELESERGDKEEILNSLDERTDKIATYVGYAILLIFILTSVSSFFKLKGITKWIVCGILLLFGVLGFWGIHFEIIKEKIKKQILKFLGVRGDKHGV